MDKQFEAAGQELAFEALSRSFRFGLLVRRIFRRPDPVKVVAYRQRVREVIRERLPRPEPGYSPEVLVIQVARATRYAELEPPLLDLPPPWMKLEVTRIADDALEVGTQIVNVKIQGGEARPVDRQAGEVGRTALIVGRIPYEKIAHIDWDGDPAYDAPRLYCHFRWRWPYRSVEVHEIIEPGRRFPMHGVTFKDTRFGRLESIRLNRQLRKDSFGDPTDFDDPVA